MRPEAPSFLVYFGWSWVFFYVQHVLLYQIWIALSPVLLQLPLLCTQFTSCWPQDKCRRNDMLFSTKLTKSFLICAFAIKWLVNIFPSSLCVCVSFVIFQREIKKIIQNVPNCTYTHTQGSNLRGVTKSGGCIKFKMFVAQQESATWRMSDI